MPLFGLIGGLFSWIFTSTLGRFIGSNAGTWIEDILKIVDNNVTDATKREELKDQLIAQYLQAQVSEAAIRKDAFGSWAPLMAAIFLPGPALWWSAVFFVSVFPIPGYHVLALPTDFYPWMTSIIGAIFFIPTINNMITKK